MVPILFIQLLNSLGTEHECIDGFQFFSCGAVFAQNIEAPMVRFIHGHSVALLVSADKAVVKLTRRKGAKGVSMPDGICASAYDAVFDCRIIPGVMRHVPYSFGWRSLRNSGRKCLVVVQCVSFRDSNSCECVPRSAGNSALKMSARVCVRYS
jgi:hypothetical protein